MSTELQTTTMYIIIIVFDDLTGLLIVQCRQRLNTPVRNFGFGLLQYTILNSIKPLKLRVLRKRNLNEVEACINNSFCSSPLHAKVSHNAMLEF